MVSRRRVRLASRRHGPSFLGSTSSAAVWRGTLGPGVANAEFGYYDSREDLEGRNPLVNNGEARFLVGYERELATELTGGFQYYLEHMLDYDAYRDRVASRSAAA